MNRFAENSPNGGHSFNKKVQGDAIHRIAEDLCNAMEIMIEKTDEKGMAFSLKAVCVNGVVTIDKNDKYIKSSHEFLMTKRIDSLFPPLLPKADLLAGYGAARYFPFLFMY